MDTIPEIHRGWIFSLIGLAAAHYSLQFLQGATSVPVILMSVILFVPPIFAGLGIICTFLTWKKAFESAKILSFAILGSICCAAAIIVIVQLWTRPL